MDDPLGLSCAAANPCAICSAYAVAFATVPLLATFVALTACYIPAGRATRVDTIPTLRHE